MGSAENHIFSLLNLLINLEMRRNVPIWDSHSSFFDDFFICNPPFRQCYFFLQKHKNTRWNNVMIVPVSCSNRLKVSEQNIFNLYVLLVNFSQQHLVNITKHKSSIFTSFLKVDHGMVRSLLIAPALCLLSRPVWWGKYFPNQSNSTNIYGACWTSWQDLAKTTLKRYKSLREPFI